MVTLYQTSRGDFASARGLTPDEAVEVHRRGWLTAADYGLLSTESAMAVAKDIEAAVSQGTKRAVVFWGVRRATLAHQGRA